MMINTYAFIKKNRIKKKLALYKRLFLLSFDMTISFYLLIFFGYILTVIIMDGSLLSNLNNTILLSPLGAEYFGNIMLMLPIVYLLQGFIQPGVLFSSAEYKLTFLPYKRRMIWLMTAMERWLKASCLFVITGLIYAFFSVSELKIVLTYIALLIFLNVAMTAIQWKYFQLNIWRKLAFIIIAILINFLAVYIDFTLMAAVFIGMLFIFNVISIAGLMTKIDWNRITAAADFKIWNMPMVAYLTKVKFKKPGLALWQRLGLWKKPFRYERNTVYHRLWMLQIERNIVYILQICGALFLLMSALAFLKEWLFILAVIIVINIYSELMNALFNDRFANDIVSVLPWDLTSYYRSFRWWAFFMSMIYLLVIIGYLVFHIDLYLITVLALLIIIFIIQVTEGLKKQIHLIDQYFPHNERMLQGCYAVSLLVFFSSIMHTALIYPAIALTLVLVYLKWTKMKARV